MAVNSVQHSFLCNNNCIADDSGDDDDDDDNDKDEEEDSGSKKKEEGPKSYYLRQNKPRTHFYNVPVEGRLFWNHKILLPLLRFNEYFTFSVEIK